MCRSYVQVISVSGPFGSILKCLALMGVPSASVDNPSLLSGGMLGRAGLRKPGVVNEDGAEGVNPLIAPIEFLWRSEDCSNPQEEQSRVLWIWCHAAAVKEAINGLRTAVRLAIIFVSDCGICQCFSFLVGHSAEFWRFC